MANFWENLTSPIKKAVQNVSGWWNSAKGEAEQKIKDKEQEAKEAGKKLTASAGLMGGFLKNAFVDRPIEKIKEMPKEVSNYFEPVPDKVRARDFARELPGAAEKVGSTIVKFGKDVLRAPNRAGASAMLTLQGQKEFVPGTGAVPKLEKFLMGDEPIRDIKGTGKETIKVFGGSEKTAEKFGMPVGLALTTLDLIPGIPKKKIAEGLGEQLITKYGDDVAKMIIKKGGIDLAEQSLKEGGEKALQKAGIAVKTVRELVFDLPVNLIPARNKATWKHSKILWNTMRNQFGEANKLGEDVTRNRGAVSWVIDTLEGGKRSLAPLMEKYAGQKMTSKQYKKLYAMFKSRNYGLEGYKKVIANLKGIEPTVIERTIEPIEKTAKEVAEEMIPKAVEKQAGESKLLDAVRYAEEGRENTDGFRGGTWHTLGEEKNYIFNKAKDKSLKGYGGSKEIKTKLDVKNPLVIKNAILEDGSFSVINSGYEKYLPEKIAKAADDMYTAVRDAEGSDGVDLAIMNGLHDADISEEAAGKVIGTFNKFDAAMDLIISKGLKEKGYDALILENEYKGEVADRHIFKLAEDAGQAAKKAGESAEDILNKRNAIFGDENIANAVKKSNSQISEALKTEKEIIEVPKIKTAESEIEAINNKNQFVEKASEKESLANPEPNQTKEPPKEPPIPPPDPPPEFISNGESNLPAGSGIEAIDKMLGETSKPKKLLDWIKQAPKKFTEAFSDRFAPMKRFEDELSKMAGQPIDINSSPYVRARMYAGRMGTVEAELQDLQKIVQPFAKNRADFTRYVLAKRASERASRGFANPAGVTEEQALQAINELKTKVGDAAFKQFENAEQSIQSWADQAILQPAVKSGIISKEAYEGVIKNNKHWIPFHVLDYLPDPRQVDAIKTGGEIFSVSKQGIVKELEGTEKTIQDPFETIISHLSQSVSLIKRNEVAKKLIDLRDQFRQAKELLIPLEKDASAPKGWGSISVFVDGKATKWAVPEELSWAMHQMNEAEAGLIGKFMRFTSGAFRKGATTFYIPFSLSNAFRDAQMAMMASKYGFNITDWAKGFGNGLKAAFGWESKLYDDFMRNGGGFGGYIQNIRSLSGAKEALFEPAWLKRTKAVINPFNLVSNFAEAIELAPRLGVYARTLKKGTTAYEAAFEARNATIDFAKAGQEMRIINMWIPFVNARWQALLNTAKVFKERPVRSAAKAGALIITPGVTTYLWNTMNYPDLYDDIPQWAKDTYFTVIVGEDIDKDGNRVPKIVQIPKGDVGQIFYNPIEYALEYVRKGEPQNFTKLALEWMSQLAPIPFTRDGELSVSQVLSGGLPPVIRTPIELATNQSFFSGYPIVPRNMEKVASTEQYDEKTPQLAVTIGRALGVSPMKLAYGVGGLLGGFGREAIDPAKILEMTAQRFYRTSGGAKINEAWNLKYETEVGYNTARQQAVRAIEAGDTAAAFKIMDSWNAEAEKIVPEIVPYLAKDDPLEADHISKSVTFQPADMARLQMSVMEKSLSKTKDAKKTKPEMTTEELRGIRNSGNQQITIGQILKAKDSGQPDLKSMREALKR